MKEYIISVITPCHNMDRELISNAYNSLRKQTIGFENIEWIVVIHNSPERDVEVLNKIVEGADNVKIHLLNNGINSPASPRNYALERAEGKYIGFLDADDTYFPLTCEKAVYVMEHFNPQIVSFRFEVDRENDSNIPIINEINIDSNNEVFTVDTEMWDSQQFINGIGLGITGKIYNNQFLKFNKIRFNEDVPFASDTLFNLRCFSVMRRICYLPHFIGYRYYMKSGSVIQGEKNEDAIVQYAHGVKIIFDYGLQTNLYMNDLMWELIAYIAVIILFSKGMSYKTVKQLSNMMVPYYEKMEKLNCSKVHPEWEVKQSTKIAKIFLKYPVLLYAFSKLKIIDNSLFLKAYEKNNSNANEV